MSLSVDTLCFHSSYARHHAYNCAVPKETEIGVCSHWISITIRVSTTFCALFSPINCHKTAGELIFYVHMVRDSNSPKSIYMPHWFNIWTMLGEKKHLLPMANMNFLLALLHRNNGINGENAIYHILFRLKKTFSTHLELQMWKSVYWMCCKCRCSAVAGMICIFVD